MTLSLRLLIISTIALVLASCTAVKVVTHNPSQDAADAPAGRYIIDKDHKHVSFGVEHFQYSMARGRFDEVSGDLLFAPDDPTQSRLTVTLEPTSITTGSQVLDDLLQEELFTRGEPMTFEATALQITGETTGTVTGTLRYGDRSTEVSLNATFNGGASNPLTGVYTLGFSASGAFDRSSLGLGKWIPAVGDELSLLIEVEFLYQGDQE